MKWINCAERLPEHRSDKNGYTVKFLGTNHTTLYTNADGSVIVGNTCYTKDDWRLKHYSWLDENDNTSEFYDRLSTLLINELKKKNSENINDEVMFANRPTTINGAIQELQFKTPDAIRFMDAFISVVLDTAINRADGNTPHESEYRRSGIMDINNVEVLEGSIINADGYKSHIEKHHFHCVEFVEGCFGSDIYSDFEPLSTYKKIEVVGHVKDYLYLLDSDDWEGNLGQFAK